MTGKETWCGAISQGMRVVSESPRKQRRRVSTRASGRDGASPTPRCETTEYRNCKGINLVGYSSRGQRNEETYKTTYGKSSFWWTRTISIPQAENCSDVALSRRHVGGSVLSWKSTRLGTRESESSASLSHVQLCAIRQARPLWVSVTDL